MVVAVELLAFSDIHNDWHALKALTRERADAFICAGDLTFSERELETAAEILSPVKDVLFIVPGNNELPEHLRELFPHAVHGRVAEFMGLRIGGIGGSPRTPWNTLFEWDEEYAYGLLEGLGEVDIFVAHAPPRGTGLARTASGVDAGSEAIRWYVEQYQPEYAVVGHIHERAGTVERVGKTVVFNPGPKGKLLRISP